MPLRRQQGRRALAALLTTSFQLLLSFANQSASIKDSLSDSQASRTLSIHLFLGRPLGRVPLVCITVYWEIFQDPCAPHVRSMLTVSVATPSERH